MALDKIQHAADLCVIGGGLSGMCAAIEAARHGVKVVLMHERPMLGGNASSEIRMWVCGAHGDNNRESGILEEIMMENQYRNPDKNYFIWDSILYEMVKNEKNITLLLNCSCMDASVSKGKITSVTGWQMTTQTFHTVKAELFADCSGDSILAPLTGASFREGREASREFNESIAPEEADKLTMGLSCMLQAEETDTEHAFIAPSWAEKITKEKLTRRMPNMDSISENFWYLELGGTKDTIRDTESIRDELVPLAYGMWDYLKNDPEQKEKHKNWRLNWVGMLPGKRESRRYVGAYTMTENDVSAGGNFEDEIAYGGWTMDDHHPSGFRTHMPPTVFHPAPSPYGIPFGTLYSAEIENLMFAGRNISVTHAALSSTRVMGTCALLGQAVGAAASIAKKKSCLPGDVHKKYIRTLQAILQEDDCFLPHHLRAVSPLCKNARLEAGGQYAERLLDGIDRDRPNENHAWEGKAGDAITYRFASPVTLQKIRLILDSDLNRRTLPSPENILNRNMFHNRPKGLAPSYVPKTMLKRYEITAQYEDGSQKILALEENNYRRLRIYRINEPGCVSLTLTPLETWGEETMRIFAFEAE